MRAIVVTVNELKQNPIPFPLSTIQFSSTILRYMHMYNIYYNLYNSPGSKGRKCDTFQSSSNVTANRLHQHRHRLTFAYMNLVYNDVIDIVYTL